MHIDHLILSLIVFFPLLGAVVLALLPDRGKTMQWGALIVTLITFLLTLHLPMYYARAAVDGTFRYTQNSAWIAAPAIRYHLGVDGLGMWLVVLSGLLAPLGVLGSWTKIAERKKLFYVLFLLQQVAMMGIFVSLDMFLYYAFWELSLVPMSILIATFGRTKDRRRAGIKYFVYAFVPSALLLVGMLWLYAKTGTFDLPKLAALAASHSISGNTTALWLCSLAFLVAFAVKVPIFPLHGWLKDAIIRGADGGSDDSGGQDRVLLDPAILVCDLPRAVAPDCALDDCPRGDWDCVWLADRDDAQGSERAGGVLHAGTSLVCNAGHLYLLGGRAGWRHLPGSEPRDLRRCVVPAAGLPV